MAFWASTATRFGGTGPIGHELGNALPLEQLRVLRKQVYRLAIPQPMAMTDGAGQGSHAFIIAQAFRMSSPFST